MTGIFLQHSQDLIVAQGLSGRATTPAAVWDFPVWRDDVESVVDEVVLQNAVIGCAGGQRRRGIDLSRAQKKMDIYLKRRTQQIQTGKSTPERSSYQAGNSFYCGPEDSYGQRRSLDTQWKTSIMTSGVMKVLNF